MSPVFEVVEPTKTNPSKWTAQWLVKATWPDGKVRRILGFSSREVAAEWIGKGSEAYLRNLQRTWSPLRKRDRRRGSAVQS